MAKFYKCSCGTGYELEENKKYKCKKCGAIMSLSAAAPAAAKTAAGGVKVASGTQMNARAKGTGAPRPGGATRPGARAVGRTRPGASRAANREEEGEEKTGMSNGAKIGIAVGAVVVLILVIVIATSGGDETPAKTTKTGNNNTANGGTTGETPVAPPPVVKKVIPPKKLTAQDMERVNAAMKKAEETKDPKILYDVLAQAKEENWEFSREQAYKALLRLNPKDQFVTNALGQFERNKLNNDNWEVRWKKAEINKDVKAMKAEVLWCFQNDMYTGEQSGLDYIRVYKAILRVDPEDHDAKVALGKEPYDGVIQEYKGKKLHMDEFCTVKELEWKLQQSQGK